MMANANLISCNCSSYPSVLLLRNQKLKPFLKTQNRLLNLRISPKVSSKFSVFIEPHKFRTSISQFGTKGVLQICHSSLNSQNQEDPDPENGGSVESKVLGGEGRDWTTSILLFVLWGGLMYYVFNLAPNQTPLRDTYFLKKLLNLKGDDGFKMNEVLVSLWYIMGLWPLVYSMLLLPTGRSSKSKIPVWPFLVLSCFGGAYLLLPYFVLWTPPPPPVEETELESWPLKIMDSKLTAGISLAAGLGLIGYAALASGDVWKEFYQYFQESKFIHATCLDFALLSSFAPFWVYNDMSARKWYDKGSWLLPLALVPLLGPALYLVLRPSLSELPVSSIPSEQEK